MKIYSLEIENHKVLGDIKLDFTVGGMPSSTIFVVGENGSGKTALLKFLHLFNDFRKPVSECDSVAIDFSIPLDAFKKYEKIRLNGYRKILVTIENRFYFRISKSEKNYTFKPYENGKQASADLFNVPPEPVMEAVKVFFSEANVSFLSGQIKNVTTMDVDQNADISHPPENLAKEIYQLLVDIEALDNAEIANVARSNPNSKIDWSSLSLRNDRFKKAFAFFFPTKKYVGIENVNSSKKAAFVEGDKKFYLDDLSSGEKQIVFRGGYFLQNQSQTRSSVCLIDEPELSLHPTWQMKIVDFYRNLFELENKHLHSQMFIATHSPFIVQNNLRENDKLIILKRDKEGKISQDSEQNFFGWSPEQVVARTLNIENFQNSNEPIIFVEGITDEKYFLKAKSYYMHDLLGAKFCWIGRNNEGKAEFTGASSLNQAYSFLKANQHLINSPVILLYDCDQNKPAQELENICIVSLPTKENRKYRKGIENLIDLPIDFCDFEFLDEKTKFDGYVENRIKTLNKEKLCNFLTDKISDEDFKNYFRDFPDFFIFLRGKIEKMKEYRKNYL